MDCQICGGGWLCLPNPNMMGFTDYELKNEIPGVATPKDVVCLNKIAEICQSGLFSFICFFLFLFCTVHTGVLQIMPSLQNFKALSLHRGMMGEKLSHWEECNLHSIRSFSKSQTGDIDQNKKLYFTILPMHFFPLVLCGYIHLYWKSHLIDE